jgi:hypothetical protein
MDDTVPPSAQPPLVEDNPYLHRGAIKDQENFFGRERETREILGAVRRGQCVSIVGPWHIGKTSLLFHIKDGQVLKKYGLAPDKFVIVYCTGQGLREDDQSNLYGYLLRKLQPYEVAEHPSDVPVDLNGSKLLELLTTRFSLEELRTLCFALKEKVKDLTYDDLPGEILETKARELIAFLARRDQLGLLLVELFEQCPDLAGEQGALSVLGDRKTNGGSLDLSLDAAYCELDELVKRLTQRGLRIVLLLDEFELFAVNPNTQESFFRNLQALQAQHALTIVTSSRIPLPELSDLDGSCLPHNFFLMFLPLTLGLFYSNEAIALITKPSHRAGIAFSERTLEFTLDVAGLHPFFLQVACDCVFERRSAKPELDTSDYNDLRQEIGRQLGRMFGYYWNTLNPEQQSVLVNLKTAQSCPDHRQCLEELVRQCLVVRKGPVYDYVSTCFQEFVQNLPLPDLILEQVKSFFAQAEFQVRRAEIDSREVVITTSKWASHAKYGDILVKVCAGDLDGEQLRKIEQQINTRDLSRVIAYAVYDGELLDDAFLQMVVYKMGTELTIVPLEASVISDILLSGDAANCYGKLRSLEQKYLGHTNPYEWSNAITDPFWFVGRGQESEAVIVRLESLQHAGIFGMRKIGKTSLLFDLKRRLSRKSIPIAYLGLQAGRIDPMQLLTDIVRQIHYCLQALGVKSIPDCELLTHPVEKATGHMFRADMLALWEVARRELRAPFMAVMIDEVERIVPSPDSRLVSYQKYDEFFAPIRDLSQVERCLVSVVTGERPTIRREFDKQPLSNAMFELYDERYLGNFGFDDCREMVVKIGKWVGVDYSDDSVEMIYEETAGHPYIARALCACLVADLKAVKVTVKEVEQTIPKLLDRLYEYLCGWWARLTESEKQLIDSVLENHALPARMNERQREALRYLRKQGFIHKTHRGHWDITVRLIRRWLEQRRGG